MIRMFTFALFLVSTSLVMAQAPAEKKKDELDLSTTRLKASYAIGVSIGRSLKSDGLEVDVATLAAGLRASLEGQEQKLSTIESREAITEFQRAMQIKQAERRQALGEKNKAEGKVFLAKNAKKDGVITLESGLQYQVLKSGKGKRPTEKDRVSAHYHGTLLDGTVFDSSVERKMPLEIGVDGVIDGWTEALLRMQVGDKWRLFVPADLAYEDRGAGDDIGPHATLIFEVELLEIK